MQSYNIKNALRLTIGNTDANNKVIKNFKKYLDQDEKIFL